MTFRDICINAYKQLLNYRAENPLNKKVEYCEKHHARPKCLEGSDLKNNLILLTAAEHFIAHYILFRICRGTKYEHSTARALWMMCRSSANQQRLISAEDYDLARRVFSIAMKGNQYTLGKTWTLSEETRKKISAAKKGKPTWNKGKKLKPQSDEHRKKLSESHKGLFYWNDGTTCIRAKEAPGPNFVHGMLKRNRDL